MVQWKDIIKSYIFLVLLQYYFEISTNFDENADGRKKICSFYKTILSIFLETTYQELLPC